MESLKNDNFIKINELACLPNVSEYGMLSRFNRAIFSYWYDDYGKRRNCSSLFLGDRGTGQVEVQMWQTADQAEGLWIDKFDQPC